MSSPRKHEQVWSYLSETDGPRSAHEVLEALESTGIGIATVYRALNAGAESGVLRVVELPGGSTRYEPASRAHHHHFLCDGCDTAFDVEGCADGVRDLLPPDFSLNGHEILLYGLCADCGGAA
jgi:Fur family transcriptional regulator, ferric uptake regulator